MQHLGHAAQSAVLTHAPSVAGQSLEPQRCVACGLGWPIAHFSRNSDGTRDLTRKLCQRCGEPDKERIRWQKMKGRMLKRRNDARNSFKAKTLSAYKPSPAHMYIPQRKPVPLPQPSLSQVPRFAAPRPSAPPEPPKAAPVPQPPTPRPLVRRNLSDRRQLCLSSLDYFLEPARAHAWIDTFFQPDPLSNANQIDVFTRYQQDFAESPITTLPGVDFINLIPQVYPSVRLTDIRGARDQPGYFICIGFKEKPVADVKLSSQVVAAVAPVKPNQAQIQVRPTAQPQIPTPTLWAGPSGSQAQMQTQASGQSVGPASAHWEQQQAALAAYRLSQSQQARYLPQPPQTATASGMPSVLLPQYPPQQPSTLYSQRSQSRPTWAVDSSASSISQGAPGTVWNGVPQSAPMGRPPSNQSEWAFLLDQRRGPDPTPQLSDSAERVITDMAVIPRRSAPTTPKSMSLARQTDPRDIIEID